MQVQDLNQATKLQGEFIARVMKMTQTLQAARAPSVEALLKTNQDLLSAARARLEGATRDREELLRRMDERIARLTEDVKRLETGLADFQKNAGPEAPQPGSPHSEAPQPTAPKLETTRSPKTPRR
jgi:predicted RNA-binding Zn ribbon-like protein